MAEQSDMNSEEAQAAEEAAKSAEMIQSNIRRFLNLQAQREAHLIMRAHEQHLTDAARAVEISAELTAINIRRFLNLQAQREAHLIMRAHEQHLTDAGDQPDKEPSQ